MYSSTWRCGASCRWSRKALLPSSTSFFLLLRWQKYTEWLGALLLRSNSNGRSSTVRIESVGKRLVMNSMA